MECLCLVGVVCDKTDNSSGLAAGLQLVTWLVPNYICSAVCICFTGFFLAPIFPCAIVMITELIPDELHVGVIGLFGTVGGAGAAAMPFVLGAMSDRVGWQSDRADLSLAFGSWGHSCLPDWLRPSSCGLSSLGINSRASDFLLDRSRPAAGQWLDTCSPGPTVSYVGRNRAIGTYNHTMYPINVVTLHVVQPAAPRGWRVARYMFILGVALVF